MGTDIHMIYTEIFSTAYTQNKWKISVSIVTSMSTQGAHRVLKMTLGAEKLDSE